MRITKDAGYEELVEYRLEYTDEEGTGFSFPCDSDGRLLKPGLLPKLEECRAHADDFAVAGVVKEYRREHHVPAEGICECGKHIRLQEQYLGACQCPYCGRWHNLFGQELLPPEMWEDMAEE